MKIAKYGFTLVELLVVVLIIGILASIALPQYQLAVGKAQASQAVVMVTAMHDALERYYLSHGDYPAVANGSQSNPQILDEYLDIQTPAKKGLTLVYYRNIYVGYATSNGVYISKVLDKSSINRGLDCWTQDTSLTDSLPQKICKKVCGHENIVKLWSSGQFGCVIGVPEHAGV